MKVLLAHQRERVGVKKTTHPDHRHKDVQVPNVFAGMPVSFSKVTVNNEQ